MNDLETQLRSALQAKSDGITATRLRPDPAPAEPREDGEVIQLQVPPMAGRQRRRRALGAVASVAAAVAVVVTAALIVGNRHSASTPAARSRDSIPWAQVGDGWTLVTLGTSPGRATLYLVSPTATRYTITTVPENETLYLSGWERDRTRALLSIISFGKPGKAIVVVDLRTGKQTSIAADKNNDQRFAGPDNHLILNAGPFTAQAFTDTGAAGVHFVGSGFHGSAVSPDGTQVAFGAGGGGVAIYDVARANALRALPAPAGYGSCAVRAWKSTDDVLVSCSAQAKNSIEGMFSFSPTGARPPTPLDLSGGWLPVRFTGGELAMKQQGAIATEPRANRYARVGSNGALTPIKLPAELGQPGWLIEATTSTDLLLSHGSGDDATPGPITELARWNPLTGAVTVVQRFDSGSKLVSFLAWNSYFSGIG